MRAALVTYFDLGQSYGIGDSAFRNGAAASPPSLVNVRLKSPLGWGTVLDLRLNAPEVIQRWRDASYDLIHRGETNPGWRRRYGSEEKFVATLESYAQKHALDFCEITVFAVGVAYLKVQFSSGIPLKYVEGVLTSFEDAAYTKPVSEDLARVARDHVAKVLARPESSLKDLTRRAKPLESWDAQGYVELEQLAAFTRLYLCVDDGDRLHLGKLIASQELAVEDHIPFEYHGTLHYSWASCILEAKSIRESVGPADRMIELERILMDVKLAHVFLGTCDAYVNLVIDEIQAQTDLYGGTADSTSKSRDLNKLRTMALAVVNLTQYNLITQTSEDQRYFSRFEASAQLERRHQLISNATEVLFNVQAAEQQEGMNRRENLLNSVAVILASLTLVSVVVDSYNFVRDQESLLPTLLLRLATLLMLALVIALLIVIGRRRWMRPKYPVSNRE